MTPNWNELAAVVGVFCTIIVVIIKLLPSRQREKDDAVAGYVNSAVCKILHEGLDRRLGSMERKLDLIIEQKAGM